MRKFVLISALLASVTHAAPRVLDLEGMGSGEGLAPFEAGTRYRRRPLNTMPVLDSQTVAIELPRTGYLSKITLDVFIRFNAASAQAYRQDAVYKLARAFVKKVWLATSQSAQLVNVSAFGLHLLSFIDTGLNWDTAKAGHTRLSAPVAAGAGQFIQFRIDVPVAYNQDLNYDLGLQNLQNDDVTWELGIDFGSFSGMFNDPNAITFVDGFVRPVMHFYDAPPRHQFAQPDLDHAIRLTEEESNIVVGSGDHRLKLPRGNAYAQMLHYITNNGQPADTFHPYTAPNGALRDYQLVMQGSTTDERLDVWYLESEQRRRYGQALPQGTVVMDGTYDTGFPGRFQLGHNILDTGDFTELEAVVGVQNLNANNSKILTVRREIVTL